MSVEIHSSEGERQQRVLCGSALHRRAGLEGKGVGFSHINTHSTRKTPQHSPTELQPR